MLASRTDAGGAGSAGRGPASGVGGGGGGPASAGAHTMPVKSVRRRSRSLSVRVWPAGSVTVVPVRNGERVAALPGKRGVICKNDVFASGPWHPLHVLSDAWNRASSLAIPGADHSTRSLKTEPPRKGLP